jgi:hypothetical protein
MATATETTRATARRYTVPQPPERAEENHMKLFRVVLNVTPQVINTCSGNHRIEGKYLVMVIAENAADALLQVKAKYDGTDANALEVSMVAVRQHEGDELAIHTVAKQADYAVQQ